MTMKKAAAIGLSTLILSSNMMMPLSIAMAEEAQGIKPLALSEETVPSKVTRTFTLAATTPIEGMMLLPEATHKPSAIARFFGRLNPFAMFRKKAAHQTASAEPLRPSVDINPALEKSAAIAEAPEAEAPEPQVDQADPTDGSAAPATEAPKASPEADAADAPARLKYKQVFPQPAPQPAEADIQPEAKAEAPAGSKLTLQAPVMAEIFQMLASKAEDAMQLAAASPSLPPFAPALEPPDVTTFEASGNMSVLRSGISQKVAAVDLSIGKAEVLHLSSPAGRVSISNPDVASAVIISPTQIQLIGKAVGVANLIVWSDMDSHNHTVVDISVHRDVSVLINQLKYVDPGIRIVPLAAEDSVILTGEAESREVAQTAIEMAKAFFARNAGAGGAVGPSSQAPGSALPGSATNIINLIKIKGEPSTKVELVRRRLAEIDPNIRLDVVPGPDGAEKVILTGRVQTASTASKALNLASVFYGQPGLRVVTAQGGNDFTRLEVSSSAESTTSIAQTGQAAGGANMLQGSVMTDSTGNVISMLEIAQKPQIRCNIKFLELNKRGLKALGGSLTGAHGPTKLAHWNGVQSPAPGKPISQLGTINNSEPGSGWQVAANRANGNGWNPTAQIFGQSFGEVYQNGVTQVISINNQIGAAIQALEEKRLARTLAEPNITMLSGEQGSFLAGGEIPIAFLGGQGQINVEFHEYGIRLNLLPTVTDDGKIQMQVAPEVSEVDNSVNIQGVPGFTTRRMNTSLLVENGQAFVLAGLFRQTEVESVSRFPGIGNLPVIGTFFRNKWKNKDSSELVVIVKPEIIMSNTANPLPPVSQQPATTELKATEVSNN